MDCQFFFFAEDETLAFVRDDALSAVHYEDQYYFEAKFPILEEKEIKDGMFVGFHDLDDTFQLFEILRPCTNVIDETITFQADLSAMSELRDCDVIRDRRPTNVMAGVAVSVVLENTRWQLGIAEPTIITSRRVYYEKPWSALIGIKEQYACYFRFRVEIDDTGVIGRYVDVLADIGRDSGMRFDVEKNVESLEVDIDRSDVATALYGRGKGEEVGINSSGDATYGRRITFADIVWSKEDGDPADKPAGQEYVEDVEATELYGRRGKKKFDVVTFSDCEDPAELLELTWAALQTRKSPKCTIKATVRDLEDIDGLKHEAIRLGDYAAVIIDDRNQIRARVSSIDRNLLVPENTKLTIGSVASTICEMQAVSAEQINSVNDVLELASAIAAKNPDLFKGVINTMVTQIMSTGTNISTDPNDGSLIFTADDGKSAVKLTGRGILIASQKVGGEWNWGTALNGSGITASVITSGVLNANLIKILGTDQFYWDAQAIFIFDESDPERNRQIRIGLYDGEHYGIGYTTDGGETWQSAIGFNGVVLGSGTVTKENLSKDVIESIKSMRGITSITEYYLASELDSGVTAASEGWTTDIQATSPEKRYLWNREEIQFSDDTTFESSPVIIGTHGQSGTDGITYYTWVKYADSPTSGMSDIPEGKAYIGLAYNKTTSVESDNYSDYAWSLIRGADGDDGVPGADGKDGKTYYTWIKYADDENGTGMSDNPAGKFYIGLAYNKNTPTESISASDYTWSLFRGSNGIDGAPGKDGADGVGISSIVNMYGLSASTSEVPTSWTEGMPDAGEGMLYLWMYEVIAYTDNTTTKTAPRITGYLGSENIIISDTEPVSPEIDALWLDTSASPAMLKRYTENGWEECTVSRAELDNMSKRISEHDSKFILMDDKISAKVSQTDYVTDMAGKANAADVEAQFSAAAELNAKNLTLKFTEAKNYTDDKTAAFDSFVEEVMTYMEFGVKGLILGKVGSSFKTQITNEKLSFLQDNEEVAFIQYNRMYITEARVTDRLSIGTEENGYFDWITSADGLGLKWK